MEKEEFIQAVIKDSANIKDLPKHIDGGDGESVAEHWADGLYDSTEKELKKYIKEEISKGSKPWRIELYKVILKIKESN